MKHRILSFLLACTLLFLLLPTLPAQAASADELISAVPVEKGNESSEPMRAPADRLQDSTLAQPWDDSYSVYNCYAYAVGKTDDFYCPGEIYGYTYSSLLNLDTVVQYTILDLRTSSLGFSCVRSTTTYPSSVAANENVICVRLAPGVDFHYMKKVGNDWLHKPSDSAILKYNYTPSNNRNWTNERVYKTNYVAASTTYSSNIAYIIFRNTHGTTHAGDWTGNHYHSGNQHYYEYWVDCNLCGFHASTTWQHTPCNGVCVLPYGQPAPIDSQTLHIN